MHRAALLIAFVLCTSLAAEAAPGAPFRERPPSSLRLLDGVRLAQAPSEPPLLQSPEDAAPATDEFGLRPDPYAGRYSGREVLAGVLGVVAADFVSVGVGGLVLAVLAAGFKTDTLVAIFVAGVSAGGFALFLTPLGAAVGAYSAVTQYESNNGMLGALLGAYAAQLGSAAVGLGASLAYGALRVALGTSHPVVIAAGILSGAVFLATHWVGLPLAASYGIHWGGPIKGAAPSARQPQRLPTTPDEAHARDTRSVASPVLSFAF